MIPITASRRKRGAAIAERAYQRWQERGCPIGDDMRDWFEAREELSQERE